MTTHADLLFELGTEELPPGALPALSAALTANLQKALQQAGIAGGEPQAFATPRRLGVCIPNVPLLQSAQRIERRGPPLRSAYDSDGKPTAAALGFARSVGVALEALAQESTPAGEYLVFRSERAGQPTANLLEELLMTALAGLPIPRRMRWGDFDAEFVRPVQWLLLRHGDAVPPVELFGQMAVGHSYGHRFHHPGPVPLATCADYAEALRTEGCVIADFDARRAEIEHGVRAAAAALDAHPLLPETLLDEVTALVEWPVVLTGSFDAAYLRVPAEALISTMQDKQRYFALLDAEGRLLPRFVLVSNIDSRDPDAVRAGNERVLRPRFADAAFFWDQDRATPLAMRREALRGISFHARLGSLYDRSERLASLSRWLAPAFGTDAIVAERAAQLAKCDLTTQMVGEFPELQGVMGGHYARADGEAEAVATAIGEHYLPRHAGDSLPDSPAGRALATADRLDTLIGLFAAGEAPTGDRDPYALRRAALGLIRTLLAALPGSGHPPRLDLQLALAQAAALYPPALDAAAAIVAVRDFIHDRLRAMYLEQGGRPDVFEAVRAILPADLADFAARMAAVGAFRGSADAPNLTAAHKRIKNLLKQADTADAMVWEPMPGALAAERALAEGLALAGHALDGLLAGSRYEAALTELARLRPLVDRFFDEVLVLAEEPALRRNRLGLVARMAQSFNRVADLSYLQP